MVGPTKIGLGLSPMVWSIGKDHTCMCIPLISFEYKEGLQFWSIRKVMAGLDAIMKGIINV